MKWFLYGAGGTLALVVVVGIVYALVGLNPFQHTSDGRGRAITACHTAVTAALRSPGSASFVGDDQATDYTVTGSVDAQNGFGALTRATYTCSIDGNGTATVTSLDPR